MSDKIRKTSPVKTNYLVDLAIFIAFLVAMDPRLTGIAIHEWLSIAFGAAVVTHLLLHWKWLVATTRRFFGRVPRATRLNYALNTLFFIDMVVLIFTGLMISEVALPGLGIPLGEGFAYRRLHGLTADGALLLLGFHVALHWNWIVSMTRRTVVTPLLASFRSRPEPAPEWAKEPRS